MTAIVLIAQAALIPTAGRPAPPSVRVIGVDRITVNLVLRTDEEGHGYRQCYVSFWNRPRYVAVTGGALPLWQNRGWRRWTPECGPYPLGHNDAQWAYWFESDGLLVEAREFVEIVSGFDVEAEWPNGIWKRPIRDGPGEPDE